MIMRMVDCRVQWCYCHRHNQLFVKGLHDRTTGLGESAEQAYFARQSDSLSISPKPLQEDTSSFLLSSISIALVGIFYELYFQRERSNSFNVCMHACMHSWTSPKQARLSVPHQNNKRQNAGSDSILHCVFFFFYTHTLVGGFHACNTRRLSHDRSTATLSLSTILLTNNKDGQSVCLSVVLDVGL